ncbi:MAG: spermidine/putrescine ABC transporter, partial [Clostridia bacterium]|nr:spermidine/putrescine ABC transporter [Clostridia bacterium]
MKKLLCVILSVLLALTVPVIGAGCSDKDRESKLKLYLPGEYIDEDIFEEFEKWYEEQTGEKVTVIPETFDTVENVKLAVEGTKADYDLLCPSDYMVEYL